MHCTRRFIFVYLVALWEEFAYRRKYKYYYPCILILTAAMPAAGKNYIIVFQIAVAADSSLVSSSSS